jgi:DNA-binding beta-propeller fold protein YncE
MTRAFVGVACAALVLGAVSASAGDNADVSRAARVPLALDQPLGIDVAPNGSLLVVEFGNRRLVRVVPSTGRVTQLATFVKPWGVARAPSGSIFVSDGGKLRRIDPGRAPVTVASAGAGLEIGPVAVTPRGDVVYATAYALYRLPGGKAGTPRPVAPGTVLNSTHGIAVARDGSLLVSDTDNNRILRVDGNHVTTFARLGHPRGIDVARDGSVYVAAADRHRIARYSASGTRLGFVGPRFDDPYALSVATNGTVFALDLGVTGIVRRIAPDGTASVVAAP